MSARAYFAVLGFAVFLVGAATHAQTHGGGSPAMPARVAPASAPSLARGSGLATVPPSSGGRASRQATVIQISPSGRATSRSGSFSSFADSGDESGVPGLGFDYAHLAAVSGNFRGNPPSFGRSGSHRHGGAITPVFLGGYPYYSDFADYQQEQPQPQVIVIQQPAPAIAVQQGAPEVPETLPSEAATPAQPPVPVREVGELILMRRDGRVLFASIFSVTGTQVQYVTPEGIRRTVPLSDLDTTATQEMNEARGTTLQFHE